MNLFRRRTGSPKNIGMYLTRETLSIASVERQRGRRPRLTGAECVSLDGGQHLDRLVHEGISDRSSPVTLVLPDDQYELLLVEAPRVEPSELRAAVRWKVRNLIDFHIDDAVIDVFEIPGQNNRPQGQAMMYAVAARARSVREHIDVIEDADRNLQVIDITEMALRNLAAQLEDDIRGVATLYLAEDHGIITVTRQGSLYLSRRLASGTRELQEGINSSNEQIALEVQRSLDYYDSHFGQPPVASLSVLPGFESHAELLESLRETLNIDVHGYRADNIVDCDTELPEKAAGEFLLALGGALRHEEISL